MGYMMSYKHRMQAAACCFLLLAAAATVQTANAAGPDSFVGSLAGHVQVRDAWHAAAPISSAWMHVPDSTLSAEATSTAAAAAAATIEIGQLSSDAAQRRMMLAQTAAPPAAAAAAQKCKDYSKDMNQHTKDGYKLRWKAFADSCSAACRKQSVVKVPDGVYKVYCEVQSCSCTLVNESTKKEVRWRQTGVCCDSCKRWRLCGGVLCERGVVPDSKGVREVCRPIQLLQELLIPVP